ncbi:hypothetical protein [Segeticoccus rhizosphaerae]|uniref:hypothetical protein n=1 Tax=Segeticoccus rhizosphaerae TaxID=1104777 RepID=UPI0012659ECE|nr:hypothetical protein [Segeticoccus rhizosphaerae]
MTTLEGARVWHQVMAEERDLLDEAKHLLREHIHPTLIASGLAAWVAARDERLADAGILHRCSTCQTVITGAATYDDTEYHWQNRVPADWDRWCSTQCRDRRRVA